MISTERLLSEVSKIFLVQRGKDIDEVTRINTIESEGRERLEAFIIQKMTERGPPSFGIAF